ncbi:hypothetical protein [Aureibacter tunicatorum]|uniref:Uncharacterized protein n=1 Tax=Aureibacter tunicatorum TaxID=866807 RepID=A0AAE3XKI1_9BACT|nr:hypothetical protein [Aureibacter tunicatorum]MDR6238562.1 hypothetical protein [Aureibacter tunicatorum]BDD05507.1 hypothetical protein AUTU_29900 [Aureibacter tunicatorum]
MEKIKILELKKMASSIIFTIGICGLLYSLPSMKHPMYTHIMGISILALTSIVVFFIGISLKLIYLRKEDNKTLNYDLFIPSEIKWKKSIKLTIISLTLFGTLLIFTNPTPGYAAHSFAYTIGYMIPVLLTSFAFSFSGVIVYLNINEEVKKKLKLIYKVLPFISFIPLLTIILIITINVLIRYS